MRRAITVVVAGLSLACGGAGRPADTDTGTGEATGVGETVEDETGGSETDSTTADPGETTDSTTGDGDGDGDPAPLEPDLRAEDWSPGPAPEVLPGLALWPLPPGPSGPPLWVSNNPERFTGIGWLQQHARVDPSRGGEALALTEASAYLFHLNASGAPRWVSLVVTNPQDQPVTLDAQGLVATNVQYPIGVGSGPSVAVAQAWLGEAPTLAAGLVLEPGAGAVLASASLPVNAIVDGRVELEASAGVFLYTVVTDGDDPNAAINATQGPPATGDIYAPNPNGYGRMAGVYAHSRWLSEATLEVPPPPAHTGLMLNTDDKFAYDGVILQDQAGPALVHLSDSSAESHGNYGVRYELLVRLCASPGAEEVRVSFAHQFVAAQDSPSFTYNGHARVGAQTVLLYTTPTKPRQVLADLPLPGQGCVELPIELVIPGLITVGHQLVFESR